MAGTEVQSVYVDMANHPATLQLHLPKTPPLPPQILAPPPAPEPRGCFPWFRAWRRRRAPIQAMPIMLAPIVHQPAKPPFDPTKHWSTIGDLHGNALKLIYFLVMQNALTMSEQDYKQFLEIYFQDLQPLLDDQAKGQAFFKKFDSWVSRLQVKPGAKIRLIGDELADRGRNDYYTLKIIQKLVQGGTDLEILFSNHGLEFMLRQEKRYRARATTPIYGDPIKELYRSVLLTDYSDSIDALAMCLEEQLVDAYEVEAAYQAYISKIKVLSYDYNEDGELNFYSHAYIWDTPLNVTIELAKTLRVNGFSQKTCPFDEAHMAELIDEINECTQQAIKEHRLIELVQARSDYSTPIKSIVGDCPFAKIAWHRPGDTGQYPQKQPGVDAFCGHDLNVWPNSTTLDNVLGRDPSVVPQGELAYLVTEPSLRPQLKTSMAVSV